MRKPSVPIEVTTWIRPFWPGKIGAAGDTARRRRE